ncbi:MAG: helix-turn-helix domain-containing protein [Phototrophicaceae bacterium]
MELRAAKIIDTDIEGHYAFYPFVDQISTRLHQHNFYEIFLIAEGSIQHHINGEVQQLNSGALVFIRPDDAHYFSKFQDTNCKLINLAFLSQTFTAIVTFLDLQSDTLLDVTQPPTIQLTKSDNVNLQMRLQIWGRSLYGNKTRSRQTLRTLLADTITEYFMADYILINDPIPKWLTTLKQEMQKTEHFTEGRDALMRLANRSPEYVGRAFKDYYRITPSQFINDLRLDYASDLLLTTDNSPTDIAYDTGFGNLSHFYHLFKARWHCSPNQYRKQHRRTLVP